jgi:SlyX protein
VSHSRLDALEERIAHLTRTVDDLSDVVARQADDMALMSRRLRALMERQADDSANMEAPSANQKPPHW